MEKVNLEGILYNEDGSFKPLTGKHGNISDELAHARNVYMEATREYFELLLADKEIREIFVTLTNEHGESLITAANVIRDRLENGMLESKEELEEMKKMSPEERDEFHMRKLEKAMGLMELLYAAAKDKVKMIELVKNVESKESLGRTR